MIDTAAATDAAAESIARSIAAVVASATSQRMTDECMRAMGARDQKELIVSVKSAVVAILTKKSPAHRESENAKVRGCEANVDVVAESMVNGRRVNPRSSLDKLLDSMVDDMLCSASTRVTSDS